MDALYKPMFTYFALLHIVIIEKYEENRLCLLPFVYVSVNGNYSYLAN